MRFRFRSLQRLKNREDFFRLRENGKRIDCGAFILQYASRPSNVIKWSGSRIGIIASKKVGNAVVRNRAKRLFREIYRLNQALIPVGVDVVVVVKSNFAKKQRERLQKRFLEALPKA